MTRQLYDAVKHLADLCDHARSQDGHGFNGFDSEFGHRLADTPYEQWKPNWPWFAWSMLKKYKKQLSLAGIDYDSIKPPEESKPVKQEKKVVISDTEITFAFPYNDEIISCMKTLGARWKPTQRVWSVTPTTVNIDDILAVIATFGFKLQGDLAQVVAKFVKVKQEKKQPVKIVEVKLKKQLRDFQKIVPALVEEKERMLICDEMGLGKTIESIASVEYLNAYPALVVCPASVKLNWQKEVNEWVNRTVEVIGSKAEYNHTEVTIINYDMLVKHNKYLTKRNFHSIIIDESHYCKNKKAQRTKAIKKLVKHIPYRIMLSGTPCLNRPFELISQLDILGKLDEFGGFWNFVNTYCGAYNNGFGWDFSGATNSKQLHKLLTQSCMIRRTKQEVLTELPTKTRVVVPIELSNAKQYKLAHTDFKQWAKAEGLTISNEAVHLVRIEKLKQLVFQGKMDATIEWVNNFLESGEKLVLFASHIEAQKQLLEKYPNAARIFGEDKAEDRQYNINRFQSDPNCNLIICSLVAAGIGITLTAASNVAFVELGWTPGIMSQAEDRCHRIGQINAVTVWYLMSKNTIEEEIYQLIAKKRINTDMIHDGKSNVLQDIISKYRE